MKLIKALEIVDRMLDGENIVLGTANGDVNPLAPPYSFLVSRQLLQALTDAAHETLTLLDEKNRLLDAAEQRCDRLNQALMILGDQLAKPQQESRR